MFFRLTNHKGHVEELGYVRYFKVIGRDTDETQCDTLVWDYRRADKRAVVNEVLSIVKVESIVGVEQMHGSVAWKTYHGRQVFYRNGFLR